MDSRTLQGADFRRNTLHWLLFSRTKARTKSKIRRLNRRATYYASRCQTDREARSPSAKRACSAYVESITKINRTKSEPVMTVESTNLYLYSLYYDFQSWSVILEMWSVIWDIAINSVLPEMVASSFIRILLVTVNNVPVHLQAPWHFAANSQSKTAKSSAIPNLVRSLSL